MPGRIIARMGALRCWNHADGSHNWERRPRRFLVMGIAADLNETSRMRYKLGRLLQFAALVILPIAIAGDMAGKVEFKH